MACVDYTTNYFSCLFVLTELSMEGGELWKEFVLCPLSLSQLFRLRSKYA